MLMLSNVLALALSVVADEPRATTPDAPATLPRAGKPHGDSKPEEVWHLTLPDAIRIGLDNSEAVRVLSKEMPDLPAGFHPTPLARDAGAADELTPTPGLAIAPRDYDGSAWKFRAEIMAHVRSVEQTYWALSHQGVVLWSRETAVRLGEEILRRERAELEVGRSNRANVLEAEQQLENFRLNLITATSDLITTERQLRNILGLPPVDGRRVVPATAPIEARLEPDWEISVRQMTESQPDIAQQRIVVGLSEMQLILARNQPLPLLGKEALRQFDDLGQSLDAISPSLAELIRREAARPYPAGLNPSEAREPEFIAGQVGLQVRADRQAGASGQPEPAPVFEKFGMMSMPIVTRAPLANMRQAQYQLLRQRAFLQQITHQATHSLARFFLEVDANYKQYRTAMRLRAAAQQRLEAQRAFYEEGQVSLDRLLDAVGQYCNAIAQESLYKSSYNTSIVALEEAKGTLLAYDKITVADRARGPKADAQAKDDQLARTSLEDPDQLPEALPSAARAQAVPMTYKLKAKVGGLKFLEIEVEVNLGPPPGK